MGLTALCARAAIGFCTPSSIRIRGADAAADRIVLVPGYEPEAVRETVETRLSDAALQSLGAQGRAIAGRYTLALAMTSGLRQD
jgi:hypothetical protein